MAAGTILLVTLSYAFALWLGLYLVGRDPRSPRLLLTGCGLVAYALALACDLLVAASADPWPALVRAGRPLLLLPALCWTGALIALLPEEAPFRTQLVRAGRVGLPALVGLLALFLVAAGGATADLAGRIAAGAVLLPLLALVGLVWWATLRDRAAGRRRTRAAVGVLLVFTLSFTLSTGLLVLPLGWLPRAWALLLIGLDLVALGLAIAVFDALDQGEALLPDLARAGVAAGLSALAFGGQVALALALATGPTPSMLALLLGTVAVAVVVPTFADRLGGLLDALTLGRQPRVREARAELRAAASALPRRDPALDPTALDEAEFARLTRRALSHFGDLPRLAASPLTGLPLIDRRLAARGAPDDALERAAELKAVLAESVARLKPRTGADFGTSDEWRHYNALYFPYVAGLKPYSLRAEHQGLDPAAREALDWFRAAVPERTLYNWQTAAAKLVAHDLRERGAALTPDPTAIPEREERRGRQLDPV